MIYLTVPFSEKDKAKKMGARWDATKKAWYVPDGIPSTPFSAWMPNPLSAGQPPGVPKASNAAKKSTNEIVGITVTGAHYVFSTRHSEHGCIPWEHCPQCDPITAAHVTEP